MSKERRPGCGRLLADDTARGTICEISHSHDRLGGRMRIITIGRAGTLIRRASIAKP